MEADSGVEWGNMNAIQPGDEVVIRLPQRKAPIRRVVAEVDGDVVRVCTRREYEMAQSELRPARSVSFRRVAHAADLHGKATLARLRQEA